MHVAYAIVAIVVYGALVAATLYGLYAIYYAYLKTKDERQKSIVLKSTAHAFSVLLIYYAIHMVVSFVKINILTQMWRALQFNIDAMPVVGMLAVLGVCLFINKRRAGGG